jgi:hypothetical protein
MRKTKPRKSANPKTPKSQQNLQPKKKKKKTADSTARRRRERIGTRTKRKKERKKGEAREGKLLCLLKCPI